MHIKIREFQRIYKEKCCTIKVIKCSRDKERAGNLHPWRHSEFTGQGLEQPDPAEPALSRGLDQMMSRGHLQTMFSVLL